MVRYYYESIRHGVDHFVASRKSWETPEEAHRAGQRFSQRHGYIHIVKSDDGKFWRRSDDKAWEREAEERRSAARAAKRAVLGASA